MVHRYTQYLIMLLLDMCAIPIAWLTAWLLVDGLYKPVLTHGEFIKSLSLLLLVQGLFYGLYSLYRGVWRYASIQDFIRIIKSVGLATVCSGLIFNLIGLVYKPNVMLPLYFFILTGFLGSARLLYRSILSYNAVNRAGNPVIIVGAGQGAELLLRDLLSDTDKEYFPVALVDDDLAKQGREIHGVRVLGRLNDISFLAARFDVKQVFVAIPSASAKLMRDIIAICNKAGLPVRTLPGLNSLAKQRIGINLLRDVSLEDLLGRESVTLDWQHIIDSIRDKVVLITGGGGSIGSELCKQIVRLNPEQLIIVDHSEFNLYNLGLSLEVYSSVSIKYELLSVTNEPRVEQLFKKYKPQIVFHAAAYKHVPILEGQIESAIFNNIIGTKTVVDSSVANKVEKFVLISTDKAVNPTNIMGATKRAAEVYCQGQSFKTTKFITVRFGNVLGSAGSVIPLFKQQIEKGGPVTVTHSNTMRYFMTIPEACQLIMQALAMGDGGEIFVLEMGKPVKIKDLAEQMILLSGYRVNKDIHIEYIGLRPGEKMVEELFYTQETLQPTKHAKILQARSKAYSQSQIDSLFNELSQAYESHDNNRLIVCMSRIVPEYTSAELEEIADVS